MKIIRPDNARYGCLFDFSPEAIEQIEQAINDSIERTQRGFDVVVRLGKAKTSTSTDVFPSGLVFLAMERCAAAGWVNTSIEADEDELILRLVAPRYVSTVVRP